MATIEYREDVLLVLGALHAGDEAEEEVHDGGGCEVGEEQAHEALLGLDVLDDLEARVLVRVPVLYQPCKERSEHGIKGRAPGPGAGLANISHLMFIFCFVFQDGKFSPKPGPHQHNIQHTT